MASFLGRCWLGRLLSIFGRLGGDRPLGVMAGESGMGMGRAVRLVAVACEVQDLLAFLRVRGRLLALVGVFLGFVLPVVMFGFGGMGEGSG